MNHESLTVSSMQSMLLLLLASAGSDAVANTYFKCVDARGAVTVQANRLCCQFVARRKEGLGHEGAAHPPTNEAPSPQLRRSEDAGKAFVARSAGTAILTATGLLAPFHGAKSRRLRCSSPAAATLLSPFLARAAASRRQFSAADVADGSSGANRFNDLG